MNYVTVTQVEPGAPIRVIGLGSTSDQAYVRGMAWFGAALRVAPDRDAPRLLSMESNFDIWPTSELEQRTGRSLNQWLLAMSASGHPAITCDAEMPVVDVLHRDDEPWRARPSESAGGMSWVQVGAVLLVISTLITIYSLHSAFGLSHIPWEFVASMTLMSFFNAMISVAFGYFVIRHYFDFDSKESVIAVFIVLQVLSVALGPHGSTTPFLPI